MTRRFVSCRSPTCLEWCPWTTSHSLGLDLGYDAVQVQGVAVVHGQHHGQVRDLGLQLTNLFIIQLPVDVDLISQPFQAGLQLYLVHVKFIHILLDEDRFILHLRALVDLVLVLILQVLHQPLHVAKLRLQSELLQGQCFQLPLKVVAVGLEHIVHVTVSHLLLLQETPLGLHNLILLVQAPPLIDEGSKLLVEALDLLLLLAAHGLDVGVHLSLHRAQQALVHLDGFDGPHAPTSTATHSQIHAGAQAKPGAAAHPKKGRGADAGPT